MEINPLQYKIGEFYANIYKYLKINFLQKKSIRFFPLEESYMIIFLQLSYYLRFLSKSCGVQYAAFAAVLNHSICRRILLNIKRQVIHLLE